MYDIVLCHGCTVPSRAILYLTDRIVKCRTVPHRAAAYRAALHCTVPHHTAPNPTAPYRTVPCHNVLYRTSTVPYRPVTYCSPERMAVDARTRGEEEEGCTGGGGGSEAGEEACPGGRGLAGGRKGLDAEEAGIKRAQKLNVMARLLLLDVLWTLN